MWEDVEELVLQWYTYHSNGDLSKGRLTTGICSFYQEAVMSNSQPIYCVYCVYREMHNIYSLYEPTGSRQNTEPTSSLRRRREIFFWVNKDIMTYSELYTGTTSTMRTVSN